MKSKSTKPRKSPPKDTNPKAASTVAKLTGQPAPKGVLAALLKRQAARKRDQGKQS